MLKQTEHPLVRTHRITTASHLWKSAVSTLTRPLVQRLLLLALSTLVAMCMATSLLLAMQHPLLIPALRAVQGVLLVSHAAPHEWQAALPPWKEGGQR